MPYEETDELMATKQEDDTWIVHVKCSDITSGTAYATILGYIETGAISRELVFSSMPSVRLTSDWLIQIVDLMTNVEDFGPIVPTPPERRLTTEGAKELLTRTSEKWNKKENEGGETKSVEGPAQPLSGQSNPVCQCGHAASEHAITGLCLSAAFGQGYCPCTNFRAREQD